MNPKPHLRLNTKLFTYENRDFDEVLLDIELYYHNNHKTYHHHA